MNIIYSCLSFVIRSGMIGRNNYFFKNKRAFIKEETMKLAISTNIMNADLGNLYQIPMEQAVKGCAEAGYKYLDANLSRMCRKDQPLTKEGWEKWIEGIRKLAESFQVDFIQAHGYWIAGNALQENTGKEEERDEELMRRSVLAAERLGVTWMVVHPYTVLQGKKCNYKKSFVFNREYYKRWGEFCGMHHVGMAIENLFSFGETVRYCTTQEELLELAETVNNPMVQICVDTGHAHLSGMNPAKLIRQVGKYLKATHIADNHKNKDEHFPPFNGTIDWSEVMSALQEIGYDQAFAFEIQNLTGIYPAQVQQELVNFSYRLGEYLMNDMPLADRKERIL